MRGAATSCDLWDISDNECVREASWLALRRAQVDVARDGPPILRWDVPLRRTDLRVRAYLGSHHAERRSQDKLLVVECPDRLVLAVADGVTPTAATPTHGALNGARVAARSVLTDVCRARAQQALTAVFATANTTLLDEFGDRPGAALDERDRPQAAAVAVALELGPDGTIIGTDSARAADCEIAVRHDGGWTRLSPDPMLSDQVRTALQRWDVEHPDATYQQRIDEERRLLRDRSQWRRTALGRFRRPKIDAPEVPIELDDLVLASDGADLAGMVARDPPEPDAWMRELRGTEAERRPPGRPHSDVAMLHLTWRQSASIR